jgi:hypothetical protein
MTAEINDCQWPLDDHSQSSITSPIIVRETKTVWHPKGR